ncbi:hypothetical protein [Sphingomonas sp.]|uniref:hypothetical protein n=1 Tax=Sphingomonas sp. TaxID=28214 RepID=UPI001B1A24ED|nr:hypothetical protein [Sphingomonas sp.]MBO9715142.1 hypothetical protein [Sphingomonas sp.]
MEDATDRKKARLLRHDRMIVANELRSAFSSWGDLLIALAVLSIALAAERSALSGRPFLFAATAVVALAAAAGAGAALMIQRRMDFHSQDGVLAADALAEDARRHYALSIHALVCAMVTIGAAIGHPPAALLAPIGYLVGAGICQVACRTALTGASPRQPSSLRAVGRLLRRPISGALAAIPALLPLLLLGSIGPGPMAAFLGLVSAVAAILLTTLDYKVVRFMTESGYSAGRIVGIHARPLSIFLILTVFASLVLSERLVALVISGAVLAALVLMTTRILAYRIHSKRTADMLVSICTGAVCLAGIAMPMLLPLIVAAILWYLHRRSNPTTWLLA